VLLACEEHTYGGGEVLDHLAHRVDQEAKLGTTEAGGGGTRGGGTSGGTGTQGGARHDETGDAARSDRTGVLHAPTERIGGGTDILGGGGLVLVIGVEVETEGLALHKEKALSSGLAGRRHLSRI
jgi:hypothetical protein